MSSSLFFTEALLPEGWAADVRLTVEAGRIASLQTGATPSPQDARYAAALPGLPNLHSHAFQRGMAGLSERRGPQADSFWTWREVMYRFLARMSPDDVEAVTAQAFMEMLESGFTRVGEFHYLHKDPEGRAYADPAELTARIAAAAAETGVALTLLPVFYAHGDFGGAPPSPGQRRFLLTPDEFARLFQASGRLLAPLPNSVLGLAPHSLRAATPEEIAAILPLAPQGPVHMHIAEQVKEVEDCLSWSGARPVDWLLDNAPVDERWCLIHATHMTAAETRRLAAAGAVAGLCPVTEANLGDGFFNGVEWNAAGGRTGIGTDSNIAIDAAQELRQLEYAQRLRLRGRNLMAQAREGSSTGRTLIDACLRGGDQALGAASGLKPGAPADLVALNTNHPALLLRHGDLLLDSWVFSGGAACIDAVWVNGRRQVANGRHVQRDRITTRYRACLQRLLQIDPD